MPLTHLLLPHTSHKIRKKRKNISCLLPVFNCLFFNALAQDIILKRDQKELAVKILEIEEANVKYKLFKNPEGPVYNLKKSEIFVIIYSDGTRETFTEEIPKTKAPVKTNPTPPQTTETLHQSATRDAPQKSTNQVINSSPMKKEQKLGGWLSGLDYMTPIQAFGELNGFNVSGGYYRLLREKSPIAIAGMLSYGMFFKKYSPVYSSAQISGIFRPFTSVDLYGGAGFGVTAVEVKYREITSLGITRTNSYYFFNPSATAFIGFGPFRAGLQIPSVGDPGELFIIGFYINPFTKSYF